MSKGKEKKKVKAVKDNMYSSAKGKPLSTMKPSKTIKVM